MCGRAPKTVTEYTRANKYNARGKWRPPTLWPRPDSLQIQAPTGPVCIMYRRITAANLPYASA